MTYKMIEAVRLVIEPYLNHDAITKAFPERCEGKPFDVEGTIVAELALRVVREFEPQPPQEGK